MSKKKKHSGAKVTITATATRTANSNKFDKANNNSARTSRFFVHFLAAAARLQRETS